MIYSSLNRRKRIDALFSGFIRVSSLMPILFLAGLILMLMDYSMGTVAIIDNKIVKHWRLLESVFTGKAVADQAAFLGNKASLEFHSWLSLRFLVSRPSSQPDASGFRAALAGTLWTAGLGVIFAFIPALMSSLWFYLRDDTYFWNRFLRRALDYYRRIPHVIFGIGTLAVFPLVHHVFPRFAVRGLLAGAILTALILLPRLITMMLDELRSIPTGIAFASYALGASWHNVIFKQVLPASLYLILAGTLRLMSQAMIYISPFIVLGTASYVSDGPVGLSDRFITSAVQIFQWALRPGSLYRNLAAAGTLMLLLMVMLMRAAAYLWRRRVWRKREGLR